MIYAKVCLRQFNRLLLKRNMKNFIKKKYIFDPKSGVIEEATPETYVEDTYLTKK
ncbi:hypothetical protein RUMLAC_02146 [[Ruminococcus] lactaris ATCC 29176]|uniref:Uncharacterized protein n=1 Tax=[Ruminococcus] lactaris ATCC 29176 TaxID=471875 RepID=B5CRP5_9FIRM|nr:hypothetical protein RUMLAC_02146 [[Ruminococcus] lactaris ATCC 29176]